MLDPEVRETLERHGLGEADIDAVELFEAQARVRRRPKFVPESLDFGDWA